MIGPKTVLTCAHNLYNYDRKEQVDVKDLKFIPSQKGASGKIFRAVNFEYPK